MVIFKENQLIMKYCYVLFFATFTAFAQYDYEPSEAFPYGRPNPEAPQQLTDFQPLIGKCKCTSTTRKTDGTWNEPVEMTWVFKYIMNGMAVQDETFKMDQTFAGSIRQFSKDSSAWYVHYYSSGATPATLSTWKGNKNEQGDIILYNAQKAPNGADGFYKITFYNMSNEGFDWLGEWVNPDETIIYPTWKIHCRKEKN